MQPQGEVKLTAPGGLAYDQAGTLFAVSGQSVVKIADGKVTPLVTANLEKPMGLALDAQGRIYVADRGTQQVKVFTAAGAFDHAVGVAGGRPLPGKWVAEGMRNPNGIAIDPQGRLWVAEETMYPKRFSVWGADGKLVTDFVGPTTYGGMGACADPDDKTRVFGNGCEFKLDYAANKATVTANLIDDNIVGELLKINGREYVLAKRGQLYQRRGDALVKVAEVGSACAADLAKSKLPLTSPKDAKDWFGYIWSDLNDDGQMQAEECQTTVENLNGGYWGGYWLDDRFHIYSGPGGYGTQTVCTIPLAGWTKAGTPTWDLTKLRVIVANREAPGPNKLYCAGGGKVIVGTPLTCYADDGTRLWTYGPDMFNDVHGSHNAPIPERDDRLYGTLSCIGTAETPVGKAFAMNSNMGRLYIMTTDGLFVGSVFQDCRIGPDAWPNETRAGAPMGGVTMGGEWFGGYFFKAKATGEYYLIAGPNNYNLIKLNGFDKLQAIPAATVTLTGKDLVAAEKLQQERAAAKAAASALTITRIATPPKLDGRLEKYAKESVVSWKAGNANRPRRRGHRWHEPLPGLRRERRLEPDGERRQGCHPALRHRRLGGPAARHQPRRQCQAHRRRAGRPAPAHLGVGRQARGGALPLEDDRRETPADLHLSLAPVHGRGRAGAQRRQGDHQPPRERLHRGGHRAAQDSGLRPAAGQELQARPGRDLLRRHRHDPVAADVLGQQGHRPGQRRPRRNHADAQSVGRRRSGRGEVAMIAMKGSRMSKKRTFLTLAVVAAMVAAGGLTSSAHAEDDLVRVSDATSPRVSYAVERQGGTLVVLLAVETLSPQQKNGGVNVRLGAAADKTVFLTGEKPEMDTADGIVRFAFKIPAERLVDSDRGWAKLRLAFAVEWDGGPFGQPRQRETFLQSKTRATHAGLSSSPADWQPLNLVGVRASRRRPTPGHRLHLHATVRREGHHRGRGCAGEAGAEPCLRGRHGQGPPADRLGRMR